MKREKQKKILIFGFIALFLCGIGDWLIGYEPQGGLPLIYGISSTSITEVPSWFYILSMCFGILSGFGCYYFKPVMLYILKESEVSEPSKMAKLFKFGMSSAPLMFISFHTACCVVLLMIQASLRAGLDVAAANDVFLLPVAASLLPFTVWCFLCDIPVTVAFVYFVITERFKLPKVMIVFSPMMMSVLAKIIGAILISMGSRFAFMAACGESWGWAFMCLAFYKLVSDKCFN